MSHMSTSTKSKLNSKYIDDQIVNPKYQYIDPKNLNPIKPLKKSGRWTKDEDIFLQSLISEFGCKSWKKVSEHFNGRSAIQCLHRWTKILKPGLIKGPWTIEQDRKLLEWVKNQGPLNWTQCSEFVSGRSGKQCRERWFNTLNPNVKKGNWSVEEELKIFQLYKKLGSKWTKIASNLKGRTENSIKNRFYSTLRRIANSKINEKEGYTTSISLIPKEKLILFVDDALEEKSINLNSLVVNQSQNKNHEEVYSKQNLDQVINEVDNLHKEKTSQSLLNSQKNGYSESNFLVKNTVFSQKEYFNNKYSDLDILEHNIKELCDENPFVSNHIIDEQLSYFIQNFFDSPKNQVNCEDLHYLFCDSNNEKNRNIKPNLINNETEGEILAIMKQLNDLESLLCDTKSMLLNDEKK